ncbi:MAG: hypothetical protein KAU01_09090 [Candidatus Cloacimonetes bacterium]|nr:hypothetical protein [Candidatus Cloacimonadota bacterium]
MTLKFQKTSFVIENVHGIIYDKTRWGDDMGNNELLNKLNKIHESKTTKEIGKAFDTVAEEILNKCILVINNKEKEISYRITEIEFYYYDECKHPDPYVHRDCRQRLNAQWYFH